MDHLKFLRELEYCYKPWATNEGGISGFDLVGPLVKELTKTYNSNPTTFFINRHRRTASTVLLCFAMRLSQSRRAIHKNPDIVTS